MKTIQTITVTLALLVGNSVLADKVVDPGVITLYQVGKSGSYCVSLTRDPSGCISGVGEDGQPINVMDIVKDRKVRFENLSDAPHDMHVTGNNAEDIPAQAPNGSAAEKQMAVIDNSKQKISCSYHGDMLGVGYRVPDSKPVADEMGEGHKGNKPIDEGAEGTSRRAGSGTGGGIEPSRPIVKTTLTDVSMEALAKARPEDVEKLVNARPELVAKLQEIRPLLAKEITAKGQPNGNAPSTTELGKTDSATFSGNGNTKTRSDRTVKGKIYNENGNSPNQEGGKEIAAIWRNLTAGSARFARNPQALSGNDNSQKEETNTFEASTSNISTKPLAARSRLLAQVSNDSINMTSPPTGRPYTKLSRSEQNAVVFVLTCGALYFLFEGLRKRKKEQTDLASNKKAA